jgi:hypothetical protein
MNTKSFNPFPWLASLGVAWSLGFVYNVIYGGELSWLRMMYNEKSAIAARVEGPRRLIVTAGSGAHYSINSELMAKELGMPVVNFGLQGDIGLNVIAAMILEKARQGDVILLIPEYLMLMDEDGFNRGEGLWGSAPFSVAIGKPGLGGIPLKTMIEDTWLLGIPGMRPVTKSMVDLFTKGRMTGYLSDPMTNTGDPTIVKERTGKWWQMTFDTAASPHSIKLIEKLKKDLEAKGATLVVSLPWVYAKNDGKTVANIRKSAEELSRVVPTIYDPKDLNIKTDSTIFADTHYHLLPPARIIRSEQLVSELKPILNTTENKNP